MNRAGIGQLVEVYCLEHDIEFSACGSWTLEDKAVDRGAEPSERAAVGVEQLGEEQLHPAQHLGQADGGHGEDEARRPGEAPDHEQFDEICGHLGEWDHLPAVKAEPPEFEDEPIEDQEASLDGLILAGLVSPY